MAKDTDTRTKLTQQISKLVYDDEPFVPLWVNPRIAVIDKSVQDSGLFVDGDSNNNVLGQHYLA